MITRLAGIFIGLFSISGAFAQGNDTQVRTKADALFKEERYVEAMPLYSQLISLDPSDHQLSYHYGTCLLFSEDKEKAVGYLKFAVKSPSITPAAWYWLGRAYHLNYQFKSALEAYDKFKTTADKKLLPTLPVDAMEKQCRNGSKLLSNLKEIEVHKKVEVDENEFFRFYDLSEIGGRIVVLPEELMTNLDKRRKERALIYLPDAEGPIYFSSYGKDGKTGKDIYRTELLPTGSFATPMRIPGFINTDQDDDFPFLHPDGKTFYFSSKGHNSMGGHDVFKATYDRRVDAFGPPENLDFAVNTPDDDFLYIVDPEHKEACFASGRSSKQGKLHVYRVSTSRIPLVITVLQGNYVNEFNAADKKARIVVEDAVTREMVTEVSTAKDGSFVLALPRSGRFRFLVECGPSGKTHVGMVDVPRNDSPQAFAQELALTKSGEQEKLVIRNFFDKPLEGDLIALALDEIKRRAKLDVNPRRATTVVAEEHFDVITRAGFTGDHDEASVIAMAQNDARELEVKGEDLARQSKKAYSLAIDAVTLAEDLSREAEKLVVDAALKEDEDERYDMMLRAAELRDDSKTATLQARTAHRTALDLEAEQFSVRQQAATSSKLALDIQKALAEDDDQAAVQHLTQLKERMDLKARPDHDPDPVLRAERAMLEKEKQTRSAFQRANNQRADEQDLRERIIKLEREKAISKSNKRIAEIDAELARHREDIVHAEKETQEKFANSRALDNELFLLRGEFALKKYLADATHLEPITISGPELDELANRIATTSSRIEAMPVDERFAAQVAATAEQRRARFFEWDVRISTIPDRRPGERSPEQADLASAPVSNDGSADVEESVDRTKDANSVDQDGSSDGAVAIPLPGTPDQEGLERGLPRNTGNQAIDAATQRFLLENELAELDQLMHAEKDPVRRDSIADRRDELRTEIANADAVEAAALAEIEAASDDVQWEPVDLDRVPMVFNRDTKEEELVAKLFSSYYAHQASLKKLQDADERAAGLNGLELMLADSLRSEMARQLMVLDLDPEQAERILPRVSRLRQIREAHLLQAEHYVQERQAELASYGSTAVEMDTLDPELVPLPKSTSTPSSSEASVRDRFVNLNEDPLKVYHSDIDHRSPEVSEAVAQKEADLARMDALMLRIDSATKVLATIDRSKAHDKQSKNIDRLVDDHLIIRTELGQRSAHITKEEWRTATDSLRALQRITTTLGLPPSEPVLLIANEMRSDGQRSFDQATQTRKKADRTEDIITRDSLYRRAYALELIALREMDRSLTTHNYLQSGSHIRGENISYDQLAEKVISNAPAIAENARSVRSETPHAFDEERGIAGQNAPVSEDGSEITPVANADAAAKLELARRQAEEIVRRSEGSVPEVARKPAHVYERYLAMEPMPVDPKLILPVEDPELLRKLIITTMEESTELDRRSMELSARATALQDSSVTLKRKDREQVALMGIRTREMSDSLHMASLLKAQEAQHLQAKEKEAIQNHVLYQRLVKYYYLDGDEGRLVVDDQDHSRYFQARSRAMEQFDAAREAELAAESNRVLGEELRRHARNTEDEARNGQLGALEAAERSRILNARAESLTLRADSLIDIAARLRGAANVNESQAALMLKEMDAQRSADLVALEMRTRRTGDLSGEGIGANERTNATPPQPKVESPVEDVAVNEERVLPPIIEEPVLVEPPAVPEARPVPVEVSEPIVPGVEFKMPKKLEEDIFVLLPEGERRPQPFIMNEELPQGIIYKVQIGAFRNAIPNEVFSDMTPVMGEDAGNGLTRYTAGLFTSFDQAFQAKDQVRGRGYRDAFVVAYRNGARIPVGEAMRESRAAEVATLPPSSPVTSDRIAAVPATNNAASPDQRPASDRLVDRAPTETSSEQEVVSTPTRTEEELTIDRTQEGSTVPETRTSAVTTEKEVPQTDQEKPGSSVSEAKTPPVGVPADQRTTNDVAVQVPPVLTPPPTPEEEAVKVLATYPRSPEEIIAQFKPAANATEYYPTTGVAPARPVEMIMGLFFTVQVGVYTKPVAIDKLYNITPLVSEFTETEKIRYSTGVYVDMEAARERRLQIVDLGVKDAFVTAYLNGERIPIRDANILLSEHGPGILAKP